jgi:hypothetical protein
VSGSPSRTDGRRRTHVPSDSCDEPRRPARLQHHECPILRLALGQAVLNDMFRGEVLAAHRGVVLLPSCRIRGRELGSGRATYSMYVQVGRVARSLARLHACNHAVAWCINRPGCGPLQGEQGQRGKYRPNPMDLFSRSPRSPLSPRSPRLALGNAAAHPTCCPLTRAKRTSARAQSCCRGGAPVQVGGVSVVKCPDTSRRRRFGRLFLCLCTRQRGA